MNDDIATAWALLLSELMEQTVDRTLYEEDPSYWLGDIYIRHSLRKLKLRLNWSSYIWSEVTLNMLLVSFFRIRFHTWKGFSVYIRDTFLERSCDAEIISVIFPWELCMWSLGCTYPLKLSHIKWKFHYLKTRNLNLCTLRNPCLFL